MGKIFSISPWDSLEKSFFDENGISKGGYHLERFPNGEWSVEIVGGVKGEDCYVVGSISPPSDQLLSFLILCHTLKKEGASSVNAILPYLAYSRQDRAEPHKSRLAAFIGKLCEAAGISKVFTIDLHAKEIQELFPMPLISVSPSALFAKEIKKWKLSSAAIVAPDQGALQRAHNLRDLLPEFSLVTFTKKRDPHVVLETSAKEVPEQVVIVDDILDTGETLLTCVKELVKKGAKEIYIVVTHGLFTGDEWKNLWDYPVKKILCTDSVPISAELVDDRRIETISILPLLREIIH